MKVFFPKKCVWDLDYFKVDILHGLVTEFVEYDLQNIQVVYANDTVNDILVVTSHMKWHDFNFTKMRYPFIFFISDEGGVDTIMVFELSKCCYKKLFVNYNHSYTRGLLQLPIGYAHTMFSGKRTTEIEIPPITERKYDWSFVGTLKSDRREMLGKFNLAFPNNYYKTGANRWNIDQQVVPPAEMAKVYKESVFVLNGRGNITINCFRIYEAIICGAIPVIIGDEPELSVSFYFNGNRPKCIYCKDWNSAVAECRELLRDRSRLQKTQDALIEWWGLQMSGIRAELKM